LSGSKARKVFVELNQKGKLVSVDNDKVDAWAQNLKKKVPDAAFDDEHIVALVGISKCCLVCSDDKRAYPYIKRLDLYPKGVKPPKIYASVRNAGLCCDQHITKICE
jgi:hypothetical protein